MGLLLKEKGSKSDENNYEKMCLLKDIEAWKEKALEAEERARLATAEEQNKAS